MTTATIQIIYRSAASGSLILQRASFPLKGKQPQEVAFDWWRKIQREMHVFWNDILQYSKKSPPPSRLIREKNTRTAA